MYWLRVSKVRSGKTEKIPVIAVPIASLPTLTSPVVWFSNTESSVCMDTIVSTSWSFHAAL
jgi:hypothetical protein